MNLIKSLQNLSIARVSTVPFFITTQLSEQIEAISQAGAKTAVIASPQESDLSVKLTSEHYEYIPIHIPRQINLVKDSIALIKLWRLFKTRRFDIIHSTTPKAGLLCAIAAKMAGTKIRLHTYTGQTWVTLNGFKKHLVKWCDKLIGRLNTACYTDSFGQKDYLINQHIIPASKLHVLGNGSLSGVNVQRFSPERFSKEENAALKLSLGMPNDAMVILFIGRLNRDKGIYELIDAFEQIIKKNNNIFLLFVGPFEADSAKKFPEDARKRCGDKVIFSGFTPEPERYMAISTLLCLPSYREGFGTVIIEAASMELPVIGTKIYGLIDAVVENETGFLVEPKNTIALQKSLEIMISNPQLCRDMGIKARARVKTYFDSKICNNLLIEEYLAITKK